MVQTRNADRVITIKVQCYDAPGVPEDQKYLIWIQNPEYKGMVESGPSIADCLKQMATSLEVIEKYRANVATNPEDKSEKKGPTLYSIDGDIITS